MILAVGSAVVAVGSAVVVAVGPVTLVACFAVGSAGLVVGSAGLVAGSAGLSGLHHRHLILFRVAVVAWLLTGYVVHRGFCSPVAVKPCILLWLL